MAQISLPVDSPVAQPQASPQQFGSVGGAVAGIGEETEQLALASSEVEGHLLRAQRVLRAKQAEIAFDRVKSQVYSELAKQVTPEDAQSVYDHSKGELDNVIQPFETDRVLSRELAMYRQQQDVEIQGTVNAKKADIITKADRAANETLGEKALQNAINTKVGGGDPRVPRAQFDLQLQSSVMHGTMLPQQADAMMQKFDRDYQVGVLDAYANSPNPLTRRKVIDQLRTGNGELDLSRLDASDRNQFLSHAEETDKRLTQLAETQNHNADLNNTHKAFQQPPFVGPDGQQNYPAMRAAVQDGKWLVDHGMYTVDTNTGEVIPDYERGEKLLPAINASEATTYQAAKDTADKERDEIFQHFGKGDISGGLLLANKYRNDFEKAKVDYYPSIIAQTKAWTEFQISEARASRAEQTAEQAQQRQDITDRGYATMGQLQQRFLNGETLDYDRDIFPNVVNKQMNPQQAHEVWEAIQHSDKNPDYNAGMAIIGHSTLDIGTQAKVQSEFGKQFRKENLSGNAAIDRAKTLVDQAGKANSTSIIQRIFGGVTPTAPLPGAPVTPAPSTQPVRPKNVPDNAVWNPNTRRWQLPQ